MQQLVGTTDPSSPLDADWDADTASVTSTDYTDKSEHLPGNANWSANCKCPVIMKLCKPVLTAYDSKALFR